jgi:hypothetical protein
MENLNSTIENNRIRLEQQRTLGLNYKPEDFRLRKEVNSEMEETLGYVKIKIFYHEVFAGKFSFNKISHTTWELHTFTIESTFRDLKLGSYCIDLANSILLERGIEGELIEGVNPQIKSDLYLNHGWINIGKSYPNSSFDKYVFNRK